ncbi:MAG TPA: hypothetical protein DIT88_11200, partial [Planctomycetaceae bacterium]|nr:hypothetical protein [Planctomycetaceae bacterium]
MPACVPVLLHEVGVESLPVVPWLRSASFLPLPGLRSTLLCVLLPNHAEPSSFVAELLPVAVVPGFQDSEIAADPVDWNLRIDRTAQVVPADLPSETGCLPLA